MNICNYTSHECSMNIENTVRGGNDFHDLYSDEIVMTIHQKTRTGLHLAACEFSKERNKTQADPHQTHIMILRLSQL